MGWDTVWNTKPSGTQKTWKAPLSPETPVFTGFQAQKKTSVDVFRCRGRLNIYNKLLICKGLLIIRSQGHTGFALLGSLDSHLLGSRSIFSARWR